MIRLNTMTIWSSRRRPSQAPPCHLAAACPWRSALPRIPARRLLSEGQCQAARKPARQVLWRLHCHSMTMWRCPHCGTPQAEASRCWVCSRSAVSCATCRHYRRAVAGHLGFCALDRARRPLQGDEMQGCWTAPLTTPLDDGLGLFARVQPPNVIDHDEGPASGGEAAPPRLVEAPAVVAGRAVSPSTHRPSAEVERPDRRDHRTIA